MFKQTVNNSAASTQSFPHGLFGLPPTSAITTTKDKAVALADDVLDSCKCEYCCCYISVGPIRIVDNKIACGRCKRDSEGVRLLVVEALVKLFNFPCRYKGIGCNAFLKWILIDAHEKVCDFKEVRCTVAECEWIGAKSSLKLHFEEKHVSKIIYSEKGVTVNLQEKQTSNFLYISNNKAFMVFLSNDGDKIYHQIKFFCTSLEACMYTYNICVYDCEKKLMFLNQKLQGFDDEVLVCNSGLSVAVLKSVFTNRNNINISFQIKHTHSETINLSTQIIECPVCLEPMFGMIYIGQCGHSLCEKCKKSVQNCPCCRDDFFAAMQRNRSVQEIRNYTLECLIKKLSLDI